MSGDCLLMQKQDGTTQCDAIFIYCPRGVPQFLSPQFVFLFVLRYFLGVLAVADVVFHDVYGLAVGASITLRRGC